MYRKEEWNRQTRHWSVLTMICYLLFLLQGDVLLTVQSKQHVHSSYDSHRYVCIVTARVVPLETQEDLQERKASKAVMSFRQEPGSSLQVEPWSGNVPNCVQSPSACWLVGYWVNADFNSLKAARRCFLSSSSRFRSSCSAFISASNLLAEERAWTFTTEKTKVSSLAWEAMTEPKLPPD